MQEDDKLVGRMQKMFSSCQYKRERLIRRAQTRQRLNSMLIVSSGVATLIGGFMTSAVFANLTNSLVVKIISASMIFLSGLSSLLNDNIGGKKTTDELFAGATEFLMLRNRTEALINTIDSLRPTKSKEFDKIIAEYTTASGKFDRYILYGSLSIPNLFESSTVGPSTPSSGGSGRGDMVFLTEHRSPLNF